MIRLPLGRCVLATALGFFAAAAHADRAEVCYDAERPFNSQPPDNNRPFTCPTLGELTVPQIAQAGWRIVKLGPVVSGNGTRNQLLIRQDGRIFRNGFE